MPWVSGVQLSAQIRSRSEVADIPILFLTASKSDEDFLNALEVGADGYMNKSLSRRVLHQKIQESLYSRAA